MSGEQAATGATPGTGTEMGTGTGDTEATRA